MSNNRKTISVFMDAENIVASWSAQIINVDAQPELRGLNPVLSSDVDSVESRSALATSKSFGANEHVNAGDDATITAKFSRDFSDPVLAVDSVSRAVAFRRGVDDSYETDDFTNCLLSKTLDDGVAASYSGAVLITNYIGDDYFADDYVGALVNF